EWDRVSSLKVEIPTRLPASNYLSLTSTCGLIHFSYVSGVLIERNLSVMSAFIEAYVEPSFTAQYVSRSHTINNAEVATVIPVLLLNGLRGVNLPAIFLANTLIFTPSLKAATLNE
ncbi:3631_t:CDS:2, partial [Funneliformis geosporum]